MVHPVNRRIRPQMQAPDSGTPNAASTAAPTSPGLRARLRRLLPFFSGHRVAWGLAFFGTVVAYARLTRPSRQRQLAETGDTPEK